MYMLFYIQSDKLALIDYEIIIFSLSSVYELLATAFPVSLYYRDTAEFNRHSIAPSSICPQENIQSRQSIIIVNTSLQGRI